MRQSCGRWIGGLSVLLLVSAAAGCGQSPEEAQAAEQQTRWAAIQVDRNALYAKRGELTEVRRQLADLAPAEVDVEAAEDEAVEGQAGPTAEELEGKIAGIEKALTQMSDDFGNQLVLFINDYAPYEGEEPAEIHLAAVRVKSDEDLVLAQEYIDKGGDYKRAVDIYNQALKVDPGNPKIEAALASAEEMRYMTEERFAQARDGMTEDEIRQVLGVANLHNIKEYPDKNIKAWFYPRGDMGAAAAVYFRLDKKTEKMIAYELNFDALPPRDS